MTDAATTAATERVTLREAEPGDAEACAHRWGLEEGLRLVKPMNLMAVGDYHEPRGSWFPSVLH
jgi:hypothetical protein